MRWLGAAALGGLLALGGCESAVFHCQGDEQCEHDGRTGICVQGHCAFESAGCSSGWAYGDLAPIALAGTCVPASGETGQQSGSTDAANDAATTGGTDSDTSSGASGSTGGCPAGRPCETDDPCALTGSCDAAGMCVATDWVSCDDPPGPCHAPTGACNEQGSCDYAWLEVGTACEDGDPCTSGDVCDGRGACVSGDMCPTDNPCEVGRCEGDGCVFDALPNGTSCGDVPAMRCCGGSCVDISTDVSHCGGCNTACAPGLACESVATTSTCDSSPANTSGRCRCQYSNAQCPSGQICRTFTPFTDRCTPPDADACDGELVYMATCPNYCTY